MEHHPTLLPPAAARPHSPPPRAIRRPLTERMASWSARHRAVALTGWLLLVLASVFLGSMLGTKSLPSYDPGQAGRAERVLDRPGVVQQPTEQVLIRARVASATVAGDPEIKQAGRQVTAALRHLPGSARQIQPPVVSHDGRSELIQFSVAGNPENANQTVAADQRAVAAVQASHPALRVLEGGGASLDRAVGDSVGADFRHAEVTSVPISLALLLLAFGALIAAGIPLLLAGTAVITAISLLAIPSRWLPIDNTTSSVVLLVGMAVGIDYSLFYLRREREERAAGRGKLEALRIAAATSGRAIVVSGLTVMISLAGLFLTGIDVFTGLAVGTITVVGVAVLGSLTALPAMLSLLGGWVDRGKITFLGRRRTAARPSKLWSALVRRVVARPALWGGLAAAAMIALTVPALGLRLGDPGLHDLPASMTAVRNLQAIQTAFPGGVEPAAVVVTGHDLAGSRTRRAVADLASKTSATGPIRPPVTSALLDHGRVLVVSVPLAGDGIGPTSSHALAALRDHLLPATLGQVPGASYAVAGDIAGNHDFTQRLDGRAPLVFAFVLGLALLLLLYTFRSVAIPLVSIGLNLLSIGAAYGVLTLVFADGHLSGPLDFSPYGGIVPWMPLFLFVILFGLSMDYHVFILSRIREQRQRGLSTPDAVISGISGSAGVVTSAAVIMVAVFSIFATLSILEFKMFGVGMAAAVLIDATVVRGVLMPAAMALLGERTWYLPRWLGWLPGGRAAAPARPAAPRPEAPLPEAAR